MPDVLIPFKDVCLAIKESLSQTDEQIAKIEKQRYIRLLRHALAFLENQFGMRIAGKSSYLRENGDRIDAWQVESVSFCDINNKLGYHDFSNKVSYYQKSLGIYGPWVAQISLSEKDRIDVLMEEKIEILYEMFSQTEYNLSYRKQKYLNKAIYYQEQSILHDGEDKIKTVYDMLTSLGNLYNDMGNLSEAKAVRKEAYMFLSCTILSTP